MEVDGGVLAVSNDSKKRKRTPKNRKKYWKKQCNISDVEEYLNDQRLQAKSGGPISEKPDEKLFFVDSKSKKNASKIKTAKQRRKERIERMKCYTSLEPDPNIDAVAVPRSKPVTSGSKKHRHATKAQTRKLGRLKQIQADIQRVDVIRERRVRQAEAKRKLTEGGDSNHYYSLWAEPDTSQPMKDEEFIEHTKPKPIKPPGHYYLKPSRLSAIEPAHPGTSYNPTYEDQQDLLRLANTVEEKRKRKEDKLAKDTKIKKLPRHEVEKNLMEEMSAGLFDTQTPDPPHEEPSVGSLSSTAVGTNNVTKRRTKAARRHEETEKKRIARLQKTKKLKLLSNDVYKLRSIKADLTNAEVAHKNKITRRRSIRKSRLDDPKQFGPNRYTAPEIDYKLTSELEGSLRQFKPTGSVLHDRFKSFQKRNMLRATVHVRPVKVNKRRRPKKIEKREFKDIKL